MELLRAAVTPASSWFPSRVFQERPRRHRPNRPNPDGERRCLIPISTSGRRSGSDDRRGEGRLGCIWAALRWRWRICAGGTNATRAWALPTPNTPSSLRHQKVPDRGAAARIGYRVPGRAGNGAAEGGDQGYRTSQAQPMEAEDPDRIVTRTTARSRKRRMPSRQGRDQRAGKPRRLTKTARRRSWMSCA